MTIENMARSLVQNEGMTISNSSLLTLSEHASPVQHCVAVLLPKLILTRCVCSAQVWDLHASQMVSVGSTGSTGSVPRRVIVITKAPESDIVLSIFIDSHYARVS